jgi:hypothetical protein
MLLLFASELALPPDGAGKATIDRTASLVAVARNYSLRR